MLFNKNKFFKFSSSFNPFDYQCYFVKICLTNVINNIYDENIFFFPKQVIQKKF